MKYSVKKNHAYNGVRQKKENPYVRTCQNLLKGDKALILVPFDCYS